MAFGHSLALAAIILPNAGRGGWPRDGAPNSFTAATNATGVPSGYRAEDKKPTRTTPPRPAAATIFLISFANFSPPFMVAIEKLRAIADPEF